jgi:hypothetical protein
MAGSFDEIYEELMVFNRLYEYKIQKMTLGFKYNYRRTS